MKPRFNLSIQITSAYILKKNPSDILRLSKFKAVLMIPLGLSLALLSIPSFASESAFNDCDVLTAVSDNTDNPVGIVTVKMENINSELAIPACKQAIAEYPNERRYVFGLGRAYNSQGDATKAVALYRQAAEQGYEQAKVNLGWMYYNGDGVQQSKTNAVEWYRRATSQDNALAQVSLGWMYYNGDGVQQSKTKALEWFQEAASQNDVRAQVNLGWMYYEGEGVEQSKTKAVQWFQKAAAQDNAKAQYYPRNDVL